MKLFLLLLMVVIFQALLAAEGLAQVASGTPVVAPPSTTRPRTTPRIEIAEDDSFIEQVQMRLAVEEAAKVPKAYKERHQAFLKKPDSGIAKLFPWEKTSVLDANQNNKQIPRETAFFSFRSKQHSRQMADLRFERGSLRTGIVPDSFGIIRPVDQSGLEDISLDTGAVKELAGLKLPANRQQADEAMLSSGNEAPVAAGKVYLLRSVHSGENDLIVALQIIEVEKDGGVIFLWKRLFKGKAPDFKD